jgi:stage V sporulation protein G
MIEITQVRIKLATSRDDRLLAFITMLVSDMLVIEELKLIDGDRGSFVSMPSEKVTDRCPCCNAKNHLRARYCNGCRAELDENRGPRDFNGKLKLHRDIIHPIAPECRIHITKIVARAYEMALSYAKYISHVETDFTWYSRKNMVKPTPRDEYGEPLFMVEAG